MEFAAGDGGHYFTAHDLPFHVGVRVHLPGVVAVGGHGFVGGEFFEPGVKIVVQAGFIVVDENAGGDVHGVGQAQAFLYSRLPQQGIYFTGDIDKLPGFFGIEPEFFRN